MSLETHKNQILTKHCNSEAAFGSQPNTIRGSVGNRRATQWKGVTRCPIGIKTDQLSVVFCSRQCPLWLTSRHCDVPWTVMNHRRGTVWRIVLNRNYSLRDVLLGGFGVGGWRINKLTSIRFFEHAKGPTERMKSPNKLKHFPKQIRSCEIIMKHTPILITNKRKR